MRSVVIAALLFLCACEKVPRSDPPTAPEPAQQDLFIVKRAGELLTDEGVWNRADDRTCPEGATRLSLYCALYVASMEALGAFDHRRAALEEMRLVIERRGKAYDHRLMGFNNDPATSFADVKEVLRVAFERLEARMRKGCGRGDHETCHQLGLYFEHDAARPTAARELYEKGCAGGHAASCNNLGSLLGRGAGVVRDDAEAARLYRKSCDGNDLTGCANLAAFLMRGMGVTADPAAAVVLYRRACDGGDMSACRDLGFDHVAGEFLPADPAEGARWLRKACDGKLAQACGDLANLYHRGAGVPRDLDAAYQLYRQSCDGGYKQACAMLEKP